MLLGHRQLLGGRRPPRSGHAHAQVGESSAGRERFLKQEQTDVLVMNGGSSSVKFALYRMIDPPQRRLHGKVDRIGSRGTHLAFEDPDRGRQESRDIGDLDHPSAVAFLIDWLDGEVRLASISAVGHRVVNGDRKSVV